MDGLYYGVFQLSLGPSTKIARLAFIFLGKGDDVSFVLDRGHLLPSCRSRKYSQRARALFGESSINVGDDHFSHFGVSTRPVLRHEAAAFLRAVLWSACVEVWDDWNPSW